MDSIAIAHWLRPKFAITIDYGQKSAAGERRAATAVADELGIEHHLERVDISALGSGDLAGSPALSIAAVPEWWPFRNQFLITVAAMRALTIGANTLIIGVVKSDAAHADGTPEFVRSLDEALRVQEGNVRLLAPAINMTTGQLVRKSAIPIELLAWAHSCHVSEYACGQCRGCQKHYATYEELGGTPF